LYRARGALRLDVEMKEAGYEREILRALRDHGCGAADVVVTSFDAAAVTAVRGADAEGTTGLLIYDTTPAVAFQSFVRSGAAFLAPDHAIVDEEMLRTAAAGGIALVPWTVNDPASPERLMRAAAVAATITDRPRLAIDVRARLGSAHP
jgi:glycerophosphoryl diester phosphodiesterase